MRATVCSASWSVTSSRKPDAALGWWVASLAPLASAVSLAPLASAVSLAPLASKVSLAPLASAVSLAPPASAVSLAALCLQLA